MDAPRYDFSQDWFTDRIPQFERFLQHLKGTPCRLLEVGSHEGRATTWLVENIATHPSAVIDTIDLHEHPTFRANIAATGSAQKVHLHLGSSARMLRALPFDAFDFAYIDGCHWTVETLEDAVLAFPLVRAGGIIAFDDYLWDDASPEQQCRPKEAIDAFLAVYGDKIELLHRRYQVWVRTKLPSQITYRKRPSLRRNRPSPYSIQSKWLRHPRKQFAAVWRRIYDDGQI